MSGRFLWAGRFTRPALVTCSAVAALMLVCAAASGGLPGHVTTAGAACGIVVG